MTRIFNEIEVLSTIDSTIQTSLFYEAPQGKKRPLLVGLHTWSFDRHNQVEVLLPLVEELEWNLLLPDFRGPNLKSNPNAREACGSAMAKQDILDAVNHVKSNYLIDEENIFLLGGSGGGHMALLMADCAPKLWKAVAAFVPICDLEKWYHENSYYAEHIAHCCGGKPEGDNLKEYHERSPFFNIDGIAQSNITIFHGKYDDVVSFNSHSLRLYNKIYSKYPKSRVFLNIFDGGHEIKVDYAKEWFLSQGNTNRLNATTLTG